MAISTRVPETPGAVKYVHMIDALFLRGEVPPPGLHWSDEVFQRMLVNRIVAGNEFHNRIKAQAAKFDTILELARAVGGR